MKITYEIRSLCWDLYGYIIVENLTLIRFVVYLAADCYPL